MKTGRNGAFFILTFPFEKDHTESVEGFLRVWQLSHREIW